MYKRIKQITKSTRCNAQACGFCVWCDIAAISKSVVANYGQLFNLLSLLNYDNTGLFFI